MQLPSLVFFSLLLSGTALAVAGGPGSTIIQQAERNATPDIVPGNYIVEFNDDHDGAEFDRAIAAVNATRKMDLNFKLFNGASIQLDKASLSPKGSNATTVASANKIAALLSVKRIWPVRQYQVPKYVTHWTGNISDNTYDRVAQRAAEDTMSTHIMTQVDQLRAKGITGKGIRVAVVDTGVDYEHPALGGCFGPGCLVGFGYDLVGDAYNGSNKPQPSNTNPPRDCNGHGTHVSGIIAAQGNNALGVTGAAPGVELGMFRVFGCQGNVNDDVLIAAFNRAYEAGADLITSSVGGSSGWSEQAWSVAVSRIVENGVPCTLSAGNEGTTGVFYPSSAADGQRSVSVASVDNTKSPQLYSKATYTVAGNSSSNSSFGYTVGAPANWSSSVVLPLWSPGSNPNDTKSEGCDSFGTNATDLSGYIVLIQRGTCLFTTKAANALRRGAKYVLIYNNVPGTVQVDVSTVPGISGIAMVSAEQGALWTAALGQNKTVTVAMTDPLLAPKTLENQDNKLTGGSISTYSSWGPTFDVSVKPQFAAPGGNILSTYLRSQGGYAVLSGTSMACPMVAGIYALLMEARGTRDPKMLETLLASTAQPINFNNGQRTSAQALLAPVPQQGAGLVQAYDSAYTTTILSASSLSFNDTDHHAPTRNFTITNRGHTSVIYTLSHIGAATVYAFQTETSITPAHFPAEVQVVASYASLNFSSSSSLDPSTNGTTITIPAGQRRVVSVSATPPSGLIRERIPVYSGYIAINGSDGSAATLPYLGVAGSMRSLTVLDSVDTYLSQGRSPNSTRVPANTVFVLPPRLDAGLAPNSTASVADPTVANRTSLIQANLNFVMGSPLVRADLVPIRLCTLPESTPPPSLQDILGYHTLGSVKGFPVQWMARDAFNATWDGSMADGTYAPPGLYRLVFHALHIFGDASQPSDYDVVETDPFRIKYLSKSAVTTPGHQDNDCS